MSETKLPTDTAGDMIREVSKDVDAPKRPDQGTAGDMVREVVQNPPKREVHPSGPKTIAGEPLPTEKESQKG